ncbi:hypothetical protein F5X96DRAFT_205986 [Biscogniauxia mediterranea]|nr:hypothetical protein F5X96DRAFT_205986 [Biscogniauxia mediterranea]
MAADIRENTRKPSLVSLDDDGGEAPYMLPSTFSPWCGQGHVNEDRDGGAGNSREEAEPGAATARLVGDGDAANSSSAIDNHTNPTPLQRNISSAAYSVRSTVTVSPLSVRLPTPRAFPTPNVVVSPPLDAHFGDVPSSSAALPQRSPGRQTKFHEMLSSRSHSAPPSGDMNPPATRGLSVISTESIPMASVETLRPPTNYRCSEDEDNAEDIPGRFGGYPPVDCHSRKDIHIKRRSWLYVTILALSIYSTCLSCLWLIVSIYQPRYGRGISSGQESRLAPSTATLLCTLFAKSIELSFVTVFVAVLGQVLTRRGCSDLSRGITLAEMTMRNWVIQPGSLLTYWEGIPSAIFTPLGALSLTATICGLLYTTASDAIVSPKLIFGSWQPQELQGLVQGSYANPYFIKSTCATPIDLNMDNMSSAASCLDVQYSGQSYNNLLTFMREWAKIHSGSSSTTDKIKDRPTGRHNLFDNTTIISTWIETEFDDPAESFNEHRRIINNVTLAVPHPGVYTAATDPINEILQPSDLMGVGEYSIRASVVSPVVNVMCVNMQPQELAPLVYTQWPFARNQTTEIPGQEIGADDWFDDVPVYSPTEWLNRTAADDVFHWGEKYGRRPPVFQLYPIDYNMITNTSVYNGDAIYILAKSPRIDDYTVCELRSWVTPKCSTHFNISGISGGHMRAHCEDPDDENAYERVEPQLSAEFTPEPSKDWRNVADQWRLSMDLNGGTQNNNASNARIFTNLILGEPRLDPRLPSMAEGIAVLASASLVVGSMNTPYHPVWTHGGTNMMIDPAVYESFHAELQKQQYTSSHQASWQGIFYPVLGLVFALNVFCLAYLIGGGSGSCCGLFGRGGDKGRTRIRGGEGGGGGGNKQHSRNISSASDASEPDAHEHEHGKSSAGLVTDYTEPQNLFALAINSPPSRALSGSCGGGPDPHEMVVPWRLAYSSGSNHYFFQQAGDGHRRRGKEARISHGTNSSGADLLSTKDGRFGSSYKRLSSSRAWL